MSKDFTPHDYQVDAMRWMTGAKRRGLWMPMGGGKTVTTLTALEQMALADDVYPALVLAPLRVANTTWVDEVAKWNHTKHLRVVPIAGRADPTVSATARERAAALRLPGDIYTLPYDGLDWLVEHLGDNWPFKTVIADELTRLKSFRLRQGGKRAGALGKVAFRHVERFYGLTGTPAPNGLKDLWGQTWFLDRGQKLGRTYSAFEQRWFHKGYDGYSVVPFEHSKAEIMKAVSNLYLTVRALEVDEPIVAPVMVKLPRAARAAYDAMEKELFAAIEREGTSALHVEAANAAVRLGKCLQIANGAIYTDDAGNWEKLHDAKLDALESIIEEANGAPVLVAYNFKHDLERLQRRFRQGRVLDADPNTIRKWNAGQIPVLFAHPASAGHGLNLADGGNILAFFGLTFNWEHYAQIIERIGPMRQKQAGYDRPCYVYLIEGENTFDQVADARLRGKQSLEQALLDYMERKK
ncbi:MAG TPA: DEAD/DEAH box helicase [Terriglobales bacterium]|nr:DEAD/DEAH box helicase [Terriglobales bacterium]